MNNLECQICCNEFDECRHRPRILCCGHTFCSICLKSLLIQGEITCPNCQKIHEADNVENININFLIESVLSPDDQNKSADFDTGYKCEEHYYELNFYCKTHKQWICRDCTVIRHKPCSHTADCDNKNDCRVIPKKEWLELMKKVKIEEIKQFSETHGTSLHLHLDEYRTVLMSKQSLRGNLRERLNKYIVENNIEMKVLNGKLMSLLEIDSQILENKVLADASQDEISKAQRRINVEKSCENLEKIITSAREWETKEKNNIIEGKKNIAEVEITLKEVEKVKQKLSETERMLSESKDEVEELDSQIDDHKSTINLLKSKLKESEEKTNSLENERKKSREQSFQDWSETLANKTKIDSANKRILELESELSISKKTCAEMKNNQIILDQSVRKSFKIQIDAYKAKMSVLERDLNEKLNKISEKNEMAVVKNCGNFTEVVNHLMIRQEDVYLKAKMFNSLLLYHHYGKLELYSIQFEKILLLEAFEDYSPPPGSLILECSHLESLIESFEVEFVYLDIGKIEMYNNNTSCSLIGNPFGRLIIKLDTSPRRKEQMVRICNSITNERWKFCNFTTIRNQGRGGELVTCKYYKEFPGGVSNNSNVCESWYNNLEYDGQEQLISGGKVFGYIGDAAGFSIITRHKYGCDTRWPLLGHVVSGLDILKEAVKDHDVNTIGIHSHGLGFHTQGCI